MSSTKIDIMNRSRCRPKGRTARQNIFYDGQIQECVGMIQLCRQLIGCLQPGLFSIVNHAFSLVRAQRTFFPRTFLYKIILEPEKKVLENKVSTWQDFISGDYLIKGLFSTGLLQCEILGRFPETFFPRTFLAVLPNINQSAFGIVLDQME